MFALKQNHIFLLIVMLAVLLFAKFKGGLLENYYPQWKNRIPWYSRRRNYRNWWLGPQYFRYSLI